MSQPRLQRWYVTILCCCHEIDCTLFIRSFSQPKSLLTTVPEFGKTNEKTMDVNGQSVRKNIQWWWFSCSKTIKKPLITIVPWKKSLPSRYFENKLSLLKFKPLGIQMFRKQIKVQDFYTFFSSKDFPFPLEACWSWISLITFIFTNIDYDDDSDDDSLKYFWLFHPRSASQTILIVDCEQRINQYDDDLDDEYHEDYMCGVIWW